MNAVKRFVAFAGDDYYPCGGWGDFIGSFDTMPEAKAAADAQERAGKWSHVVDLFTGETVGRVTG